MMKYASRFSTWCAVVASLALAGCESEAPWVDGVLARGAQRDGIIYVDGSANGRNPDGRPNKPYHTIADGLAAACALGGHPTVLVAAGDYREQGLPVLCPMTIRGELSLIHDADGRPVGYDEGSFTRVLDIVPASGTLFRVLSSDVTIEHLVLDAGAIASLNSVLQIGGFPDGTSACPSAAVDGVQIRSVVATNANLGILAYNAGLSISDVYSHGNGIGATLFGGIYDNPGQVAGKPLRNRLWVDGHLYVGCTSPRCQ